jgi:hypothetical protein
VEKTPDFFQSQKLTFRFPQKLKWRERNSLVSNSEIIFQPPQLQFLGAAAVKI